MPIDPENRTESAIAGVRAEGIARPPERHRTEGLSILEGVRRSEPEALGVFFDRYFDRIYGVAYRMLGNRIQAEDAAQEVCYRIQRSAHRLDPTRDPMPFLLTTTMNVCRSLWRSSAHRMARASQPVDGETGADWARDPSRAPDEQLMVRERERLVQAAVQELEPAMREVVVLHDYQGLDHREIAQVLGLSHEAVRKRYSRALAVLAGRLKSVIQ